MVKQGRRSDMAKTGTKNLSRFEALVLKSFRKKKINGKVEVHDMKKVLVRNFFTRLSRYVDDIGKNSLLKTHQMDRVYLFSVSTGSLELKNSFKEHYLSSISYENIERILNIKYIGNPKEKPNKVEDLLHVLYKSIENYRKTCKKEFIQANKEILRKIKSRVIGYLKELQPASDLLEELGRVGKKTTV